MKKSQLRNIIKEIIIEQQLGDTLPYDGVVNQTDLDYVNNNWLQPGDVYDSNDNILNLTDLTLVTNNWGQGQSTGCTQQDFDYNNPPCGHHLQQAPGNAPSFNTWLTNQWNAFNGNAGCYQLGAIQNWIANQLASGVTGAGVPLNPTQIARKEAKGSWAQCMKKYCSNIPGATQPGC